ncbi:two-partner secretion domain-containing protein [Oscillatoria sp. FACHB-1407]|uniref:two-partner secretion domain-containing protein n=1 Tax=Oscillatoria sp. FACHB-1407 TaxID=2692847 RepID=UPI001682D0B6|nr:S-layer family protein [Oscillatoria sp. FACHB-1407]
MQRTKDCAQAHLLMGWVLAGGVALFWGGGLSGAASAQIVPDETLGVERSHLNRNVQRGNQLIDQITGGATRGSLLFHSFEAFNVGQGQQVYFSNPAGIGHILSRVTGSDRSDILGTLGVDGNANLFLLNPNGILFGADARLDIRGSFVASTADSFLLNDGLEFSATNPEAPPLLVVSLRPGLQPGGVASGTIVSAGNLSAGQDLTLVGDRLDLTGQLQAGGDLTLLGNDVQIRDSVTIPFVASATGQLLVQGDRTVDIFALNHPSSGLFAGGDLVLRSPNAVTGDARYTAGGNFRIEQPNGGAGALTSPNDPVIRAGGNVRFGTYTGASLHIFAGGSVTIDSVEINAPDPVNGIQETVNLSNGGTIAIDGRTRPTLDVRAGTTAVGTPGVTGTPPAGLDTTGAATSGAIAINSIRISQPNGLVFLSNQYQPNADLTSGTIRVGAVNLANDAGGGSVVIDARDRLQVSGVVDTSAVTGNAGDVQFLAEGDLELQPGSEILARGFVGGAIDLSSGGNLSFIGDGDPNPNDDDFDIEAIASVTTGNGTGRNVTLEAPSIFVGDSEILITLAEGATGRSGDLTIRAGSFATDFAAIVTDVVGTGTGGNVLIEADTINMNNVFLGSVVAETGVGNSGTLTVNARLFSGVFGTQIGSQTRGQGNAGDVTINTSESISFDGSVFVPIPGDPFFAPSGAFSSAQPRAIGSSGRLTITTPVLSVTNGAQLRTTTEGSGNAGVITINANEVTFDGTTSNSLVGVSPSAAVSEVLRGSDGRGGDIRINTQSLTVTNGAQIRVTTEVAGDAGNIQINASDSVTLAGADPTRRRLSGLFADTQPGSTGNSGSITVTSDRISLEDGAQIVVGSRGTGQGGDVRIRANRLALENDGFISAETASNQGGDIELQVRDLITLRDNSRISTTAGTARAGGDGGNITINSEYIVAVPAENSDITANAFEGRGGNIRITTQGIFGIEFREENTPLSDITATSEFGVDGVVEINRPDVDPSRGLVALPADVVDASQLIARGCSAGGALAQELGEFVVTGRGGLPPNPTEALSNDSVLVDWETLEDATAGVIESETPLVVAQAQPIVEAQGLVRQPNGRVVLATQPTHATPHNPWMAQVSCQG